MKKWYLLLTIIGFLAPNIWVAKVTMETGNVLLWLNPIATFSQMFANDVSTAFSVDLLFVVVVFFVWSYQESVKLGMKKPWVVWLLTMLFGLAGGLPLFLYQRQVHFSSK